MKYNAPYGVADPNAPYVNGDPSIGRQGSIPPAESIEYPQREIVAVISDVGLSSPNNNDLAQMSAATRFMRPQYVLDVGTPNHIHVALDPAPAAWAKPLSFFVQMGLGNGNTSPGVDVTTDGVAGATAAPLVKRSGAPLAIGDLVPGCAYLLTYDGVKCRCISTLASDWPAPGTPGGGAIEVITGNRDYYINPSTGNDSNDGKTSGTAWRTLQYAYNWVQRNIDLAGYTVTFHCADGVYPTGLSAIGIMRGQSGPANVIFVGNTTTPGNALISISAANAGCFALWSGAKLRATGFKYQSVGNYCTHLSAVGSGSELEIGVMDCGAASGIASGHIGAMFNGYVNCMNNYTISGGGSAHQVTSLGASLGCVGLVITLLGTPNFTSAFASAQNNGSMMLNTPTNALNTYVGGATGIRYYCSGNGTIFTNGAGANYLPGNIGGSVVSGGQYT